MAGGFRAQPKTDIEKLTRQVQAARTDAGAARSAARVRNSAVTGGAGLTIGDAAVAPTIRLFSSVDDQQGRIFFAPSDADIEQDWGSSIIFQAGTGTGAGALWLNSPTAPESRFDNLPAQTTQISLDSGDGVNDGAAFQVNVGGLVGGSMYFAVKAGVTSFSTVPRIELGNTGRLEDDATSFRFFAGIASLVFPQSVAEARVRDSGNAAYVPIRASAFTVSSSRDVKQSIGDLGWSPLEVVKAAKARRWHYRETEGDPARVHVGPMAEDLPDEIVDRTSETPALDVMTLVGVLWGAVQELAAEVAELRGGGVRPADASGT